MVVQQHTEQAIAIYFQGREPQSGLASKLLSNPFPGKTAKELTEMYCPEGGHLGADRQSELEVLIQFGYLTPNVLFFQECTADIINPELAECASVVLCDVIKGKIICRVKRSRRYKLAAAMFMSRWHNGPPVSHAQASLAIAGPPTGKWLTSTARDALAVIGQRAMDVWVDDMLARAECTRADIGQPDAQDPGRESRVSRAMRVWCDRLHDEEDSIDNEGGDAIAEYELRNKEIAKTMRLLRKGMNNFMGFVTDTFYLDELGSRNANVAARENVREHATKLLDLIAQQASDSQIFVVRDKIEAAYQAAMDVAGYAVELFTITSQPDDNAHDGESPIVAADAPAALADCAAPAALADCAAPAALADCAVPAALNVAAPIDTAPNDAAPDDAARAASLDMRGVLADLVALLEQLRGQLAAGK